MILTDEHNGKDISIDRTTTLIVRLPVQFGTGYSWEVAAPLAPLFAPVGKPRIEPTEATGPGRQERQVFTVSAVEPGHAVLKFQYVRPWEKGAKPEKIYSVKVTVE